MNTHEPRPDDLWGDDEQALLRALPTDRAPSSALKARTIAAARVAGYVGASRRGMRGRAAILLAAASLVFAAGALVGYAIARRATPPAAVTASSNRQAVASTTGLTITTDSTRRIVWY